MRGIAVGVRDHIVWEVQWHPASGAGIRRLVVTWRDARRLLLALGIACLVVVAGWSLAGLDGLLTGFTADTARRQNRALRAQQEALREQAFDLTKRLSAGLEHGRRMARVVGTPGGAWKGQSQRLPTRETGDEALLAWLSTEGMRLEAIGNELTVGRVENGMLLASVPAPAGPGPAPERDGAVLQVADLGSAGRQTAAPAKR